MQHQVIKEGKGGSVTSPNVKGLINAGMPTHTPSQIGGNLAGVTAPKSISPARFTSLQKAAKVKI